jgi:hypothetical protein
MNEAETKAEHIDPAMESGGGLVLFPARTFPTNSNIPPASLQLD